MNAPTVMVWNVPLDNPAGCVVLCEVNVRHCDDDDYLAWGASSSPRDEGLSEEERWSRAAEECAAKLCAIVQRRISASLAEAERLRVALGEPRS